MAGGSFESLFPSEIAPDHHEHPEVSDAREGEGSHSHGDADDHHETPDSPCHHHVVQCCCAHSHVLYQVGANGLKESRVALRIDPFTVELNSDPALKSIFHVPIA